ncbi:hypothetical protein [Qipengyuania aquimaris]|uniref:hypothetical protein n=1 Tax=Qipengyuania aquimaris TaxID=255984 RepID=UPI001FD00250|nr:hypothetical protein [Qipengyuania aquimaris]UOR16614.1 hypothetical protein LCM05_06095 [Qipengyuania aquimaris]
MIAAGLRLFPDLEDMPTFMAVIFVLFGLVLVYAGFYHARLRILRRRAYAGGRERRGTVRYLKPLGDDDALAYLVFANSHSEWLLSVDTSSIRKVEGDLSEGVAARAYLGDDDKIYGLDIGKVKALPISVGEPFEGKLKERIEWAERKKAEWAERAASD